MHNIKYNPDRERNPVSKILTHINHKLPTELIYQFIVCDYGINKICRAFSLKMNKLHTILDELLFQLEAYHEYDDIDNTFYGIAEIVMLMLNNGGKCAGELSYSNAIAEYNRDPIFANNTDTYLVRETNVDYIEYIFKCLSIDRLRFDYLNLLKQTNKQYLNANLYTLINIVVVNRNYSDEYNPAYIARQYQNIIGIDSIVCDNLTLIQTLTFQNDLHLLNQISEHRLIYHRILSFIEELKKIT